ncbi:hypothetical protein AZ54_23345 [Xanthomonas oryzae pv. oryzae PXO86]|nr:hypothetical protein AZ54_23345 [Xanthomonas oryzae pv. oryzae PXO86]
MPLYRRTADGGHSDWNLYRPYGAVAGRYPRS